MADKFRPILSCLSCLPFFQSYTNTDAAAERFEDAPCEIEEGLFLGSDLATLDSQSLKKLNVTHILTLITSEEEIHYPEDFIYKKIKVDDPPNTNKQHLFDESIEFIDEAKNEGGLVLVHCHGGVSEGAAVVIAYLMKKHDKPLRMALDHVLSKMPQINVKGELMAQLEQFENFLAASRIQGAIKVQATPEMAIEIGLCLLESVSSQLEKRVHEVQKSLNVIEFQCLGVRDGLLALKGVQTQLGQKQ